jgi:methylglutaconyl-CoA hydratase
MCAMTDATLLDVAGGVATITLNRPDNRNALSVDLVESLASNLTAAVADPAARVIVLTGTGNTFCAGADLKERKTVTQGTGSGASPGSGGAQDDLPTFVRVFQMIQSAPKPVVGKLNGHAMAGGLGLACCCDLTIAPESAMFGFTEVRIGVAPAIISVVCLPKLRTADAAELFLTGERIPAKRAAEVGLITKAVPDGELDAAAAELVGKLLLGGPGAMAATKRLLAEVPGMEQGAAFRWTAALSAELFASPEAAEGMGAFAAKRRPSWVPSADAQ